MIFKKRSYVPMTRADWAWVLACFFCGTLFAVCELVVETGQSRISPGAEGSPYAREITFETNGDIQKIIQAVHVAAPDSHAVFSTHPHFDFLSDWFAAVFSVLMISCLFRIFEKICGRLLGLPVRVGIGISSPQPSPPENQS